MDWAAVMSTDPSDDLDLAALVGSRAKTLVLLVAGREQSRCGRGRRDD